MSDVCVDGSATRSHAVSRGGMVTAAGMVVGRVGALAVALGIGAAVLAMPGLAVADAEGSAGASGSAATSGPSDGAARGSAGVSTRRAPAASDPDSAAGSSGALGAGRSARAGRQAPSSAPEESPALDELTVPTADLIGSPAAPVVPAGAGTVSEGPAAPAAATAVAELSAGTSGSSYVAPSVLPQQRPSSSGRWSAGLGEPELVVEPSAAVAAGTGAVSVLPASASASASVSAVLPVSAPASVSPVSAPMWESVPAQVFAKAAAPVVPPLVEKIDADLNAVLVTVVHGLMNLVSTLPVNSATSLLEGGLLMVRRSLFNQSASVSAMQTVNTSQLVRGQIDVIDPEGDGWSMEVVGKPGQGEVSLGTPVQANGIGGAEYVYTPGPGYSGADSFVVKVSPTGKTFNLFHPFGALAARYVTVAVGKAAVSDMAVGSTAKDTLDTSLYMADAAATVTVTKQGLIAPRYLATVTLPAGTAGRAFSWMDTRGRMGEVSAQEILGQRWSTLTDKAAQNGVRPMLVFNYTDQGVDKAVFVDVSKVSKNADGSYQLSGQLMADAPAQDGRVDTWDFSGIDYKAAYQNYLSASGLKDCQSGAQCSTVTAVGIVAATTLSPSAFVEAGGHDYPLPNPDSASATQTSPGAMGPGTTIGTSGANAVNGTAVYGNTGDLVTQLAAMIPWGTGGSFITASNLAQNNGPNNGIYLYTANAPSGSEPTWAPAQLIGNGWNAAVNAMSEWDQVLYAPSRGQARPVPASYVGSISNGQVYRFTGSINNAATYTGSISNGFDTPATFTGSINGTTLTAGTPSGGKIDVNRVVVGGTAPNTTITNQISGTPGGAGTYTVTPSQTWPANGGTGTLTAGKVGNNLVLTLPSGVDPQSLVGGIVSGDNVAAGTTITKYSLTSSSGKSLYTLNRAQVVGVEPITVATPGTTLSIPVSTVAFSPESLVGQTVTGSGVAPDTVITGYVGQTGSTLTYTVNTASLVNAADLSVAIPGNLLELSVPQGVDPASLIGQSITGDGVTDGTVITGFVSNNMGSGKVTYTVNNPQTLTPRSITTQNLQYQPALVVGLSNGAVEYWNGGGCSQTPQGCDPAIQSQAAGGPGWTELQRSNADGWGQNIAVNTVVTRKGGPIYVGLSDGRVYSWDSPILPDGTIVPGPSHPTCGANGINGCWTKMNTKTNSAVNAMTATPLGVLVGYADGSVQQLVDGVAGASQRNPDFAGSSAVRTLVPYDGATLVGAISGAPIVADNGVLSVPSYASAVLAASPELAASTSACTSSYNSGSGTGCSGYVLTVQQSAGNTLYPGKSLYGAAGIAPGTTITKQISDAAGNLCAVSCNSGGTGVYLVDTEQLVAPGTPMSASAGYGAIVGLADGSVLQYNRQQTSGINPFETLQGTGWGSPVNTAIPWRDGIVVSLNNGATFYWSPSNNPGRNNPNNPNALTYPGSTVTSQNTQGKGWSQLQGVGWNHSATSMAPLGDGFAVGLTAPPNRGSGNSSLNKNGTVQLFTGFGPSSSTTSAFGYRQGVNGPEALTPTNSFTEIAGESALSGNAPNGSVQQLVPISQYVADASGNLALRQSLVTGLTNNSIYSWTGSNLDRSPTNWVALQPPGTGNKPTLTSSQLKNAWTYGRGALEELDPELVKLGILKQEWAPARPWGSPGGVGAPEDPVFGLPQNQAWCGSKCDSYGDYSPIVVYKDAGKDGDGALYSIGSTVKANIDLRSTTYGYVFYPNGFINKFRPSKYSVGVLSAIEAGPSVTLDFKDKLDASETDKVAGPSISLYELTPFGSVEATTGIELGILAGLRGLSESPEKLDIAHAYYTPGLLFTYNVNGYRDKMSLSSSSYSDVNYLSPKAAAKYFKDNAEAYIEPVVNPFVSMSWGLFTPSSTPLIGKFALFDLGLQYQNPVSFTLSTKLANPSQLDMKVTSQGYVVAGAEFLPKLTSLLSSITAYQVYSVDHQLQPVGTMDVITGIIDGIGGSI